MSLRGRINGWVDTGVLLIWRVFFVSSLANLLSIMAFRAQVLMLQIFERALFVKEGNRFLDFIPAITVSVLVRLNL